MRIRAISIAGSDSSGGAGVEADLAAFTTRKVRGHMVLTAKTIQTPEDGVVSMELVPLEMVVRQLGGLVRNPMAKAAKTGMLGSADVVRVVARFWAAAPMPLVVDPVLRSSSGADLSGPGAVEAYRELLPFAALVTPNLPEARQLADRDGSAGELAQALVEAGAGAALVTGGHGEGDTVDDVLCVGGELRTFSAPRIADGTHVHGTGCHLSAIITAHLALGDDLEQAVEQGIASTRARIAAALG
ncbi:MAG: hydroxymethylpyrimidine/phosphomethylpyrimidine kinase [Proteobacteria bacterium]|nr:hydroxymethylpyrimidine/phosphomethylpyrimidine kinase [Pseudomonadota bacterium]